ncbi:DegT/DnrJ/EryC1/StrS family aminotransferase [Sulfitobacter mediterraneus]|uniref:DegT/DnrJ/EryC1/StrS family aminotransferase n=1 Tax=Sulfitobacter mediterraneus TaxID=83219 RepID=UPI0021A489F7|nr:aminotransferase class I/II-fold pyridoxal phosphate-dependent enzyme [Sulfitobacter mediterraneus]UWR12593.1 aminotransferase class I/II-fold pyridoxal phosphate-dependent enzyme [Sulfitobacter mediterraneus]
MPLPDLHQAEAIPTAAQDDLNRILQNGDLFRYTAASDAPVTLLEQDFARMMGSAYALAVSSCSAALFLSLKALNLPAQARVLIPGFTFAAVPSAVLHAGCRPVLCEVANNYRININDFAEKLPSVQAVIISHMRGHTSDMDAILRLCAAADIPVIEDAAHSLGTLWHGQKIGTLGKIGCFSFQSYKMINAGEGGILITDDADLVAQAIIMSGAYEHNWKKHTALQSSFARWQNKLPLYNLRMSNLAATVIRPQLAELPRRTANGLRNHDHVAEHLSRAPQIEVPAPLPPETRAPDSIQFNLTGMTDNEVARFAQTAADMGVKVQVFGMSDDNARAFWNWQFIPDLPDLPQTRDMLMRACDVRLPVQLTLDQLDAVCAVLLKALDLATQEAAA